MPFACRIVPEYGLAVVVFAGVVDEEEALVATGELALHPEWVRGRAVVWDGRRVMVADNPVDGGLQERVAAVGGPLDEFLGEGPAAVLLRPEADAETALVLGALGWAHPGREVRTFFDVAEAAAWLGVPAEILGEG